MRNRFDNLIGLIKPIYTGSYINKVLNKSHLFFGGISTKLNMFFRRNFVLLLFIVLVFILPFIIGKSVWLLTFVDSATINLSDQQIINIQKKVGGEIEKLNKKLDAKTPSSFYLIINSVSNEFTLCKGKKIIKTDKCSTGSYVKLKGGNNQEWMFKTPKGEFIIRGKTKSPVWKKPDWAFVEDGMAIPSANHDSRFEYGVLGDYSLSLGGGYLIHGTLYQRFLGLPVTHGCIRLNDENLELVFRSMSYGSKVYIF